jgi:hypothetical protein
MIRTHILRVDASQDVGSGAERLNVDVVDSDGLPEEIGFKSSQVGGASDEIVLGIQNQYVTGQLVQYNAAGTALGGLSDGGYYYTIVSADGLRVALAATLADAKAGNALDISPTGTLTEGSEAPGFGVPHHRHRPHQRGRHRRRAAADQPRAVRCRYVGRRAGRFRRCQSCCWRTTLHVLRPERRRGTALEPGLFR